MMWEDKLSKKTKSSERKRKKYDNETNEKEEEVGILKMVDESH
jgi:hypothetical protein